MDNPRIIYTPHPDATPEGELNALATIYAFVLQKHRERQQAASHNGCPHNSGDFDEAKEVLVK